MHSYFRRLLPFFCSLLLSFQLHGTEILSHTVLVSIAPYTSLLKEIAGDTIEIVLLVPPGASFHTFEPTPRQVLDASKADIWFRVGESFEGRAMQALQHHRPNMRIVDLRKGVDLITVDHEDAHCCPHCCHEAGADLHIWLSPKQTKIQAQTLADALIATYPEHRLQYEKGLQKLLADLDTLDAEIRKTLSSVQERTILVGHPAYAYFARDYNLKQLPIEFEGKEPSPRQLCVLLDKARQAKMTKVYVQPQYSKKGAELVANALGAQVIVLDPYSGNYFESLREIARRIAETETKSIGAGSA